MYHFFRIVGFPVTIKVGCLAHDISHEKYKVQKNQTFKFEDKVCQYKRKKDWKNYNPKKMIHNLVKRARKEVILDYCVILNVDNIADPIGYMLSLNKLRASPNRIILYLDKDYDRVESLAANIEDAEVKNWQISQNLIPDMRPDIEDCIINYKSHLYFNLSDLTIHPRFFDWLDCQVNDYGFGFMAIKGRHQLVPRLIYETSNMSFKTIVEK